MGSGEGVVVRALRARQSEIEQAVFARVREAVPDHAGDVDSEYVQGLRTAVTAAVDFGLTGIEDGGESAEIPREAAAQAQLAARSGVSLEAVLRRYIAGHALLWDYVMEEADRVERTGRASGLRRMSRAQAALLDQLVVGVTREHVAALQRAGRSREQRLLERVRMLLAGEDAGTAAAAGLGEHDVELNYDLEGEHLGVIARGAGAGQALGDFARELDRRLLSVVAGEKVVWAWLGGRRAPRAAELEHALSALADRGVESSDGPGIPVGVQVAVGEPARGVEGWRLTHRQAQAAWLVALRRAARLTCYGDVALLAAALKDEMLSRSLLEMYVAPLEDTRAGGPVLLKTLHAYVEAERNASSAAIKLQVARSTVINRLRTVEERLGRTLQSCLAEFEVALSLEALGVSNGADNTTLMSDFT
jgi:hypothetical protein